MLSYRRIAEHCRAPDAPFYCDTLRKGRGVFSFGLALISAIWVVPAAIIALGLLAAALVPAFRRWLSRLLFGG